MTTLLLAQPDPFLCPKTSPSVAYEASRLAKSGSGVLYGLTGYNSGPAQFIQLHDAVAVPANGAVPVTVIAVPATSNFTFDFGVYGRPFLTGIVVCNSTTGPTKTLGAADCFFDPLFK